MNPCRFSKINDVWNTQTKSTLFWLNINELFLNPLKESYQFVLN